VLCCTPSESRKVVYPTDTGSAKWGSVPRSASAALIVALLYYQKGDKLGPHDLLADTRFTFHSLLHHYRNIRMMNAFTYSLMTFPLSFDQAR